MLKIKLKNCRFENLMLICIAYELKFSESKHTDSCSLVCLGFSCDGCFFGKRGTKKLKGNADLAWDEEKGGNNCMN